MSENEEDDEHEGNQSSGSDYQPSRSESDLSVVETASRAASRINGGGRRNDTTARPPPTRSTHAPSRAGSDQGSAHRNARTGEIT